MSLAGPSDPLQPHHPKKVKNKTKQNRLLSTPHLSLLILAGSWGLFNNFFFFYYIFFFCVVFFFLVFKIFYCFIVVFTLLVCACVALLPACLYENYLNKVENAGNFSKHHRCESFSNLTQRKNISFYVPANKVFICASLLLLLLLPWNLLLASCCASAALGIYCSVRETVGSHHGWQRDLKGEE